MKRRGIITVLLIVLLLLIANTGVLLLVKPSYMDAQRRAVEEELLATIESGETQIVLTDLPPMEGEESEFSELGYAIEPEEGLAGDSEETEERLDPGEITGYGVIMIPSIDLKMPLVVGADSYSLRAAAGWYPESAEMGQAGNCAIFGHRMTGYGRHFNRLDEVKTGDKVSLFHTDGNSYTYIVTETEIIEPALLMDRLREHNEGYCLTLVTCTPTGVGSHRLLVYAELEE